MVIPEPSSTDGVHLTNHFESVEELRYDLLTGMSRYSEGCNNEALRVFSDVGEDEDVVNYLTAGLSDWKEEDRVGNVDFDDAMDAHVYARTIKHMSRCFVGTTERCEDTKEVMNHHFPWLHLDCNIHRNKKSYDKTLPIEFKEEIERLNHLEMGLYKIANAMLDADLRKIRGQNDD